jgi:hypothetical protein
MWRCGSDSETPNSKLQTPNPKTNETNKPLFQFSNQKPFLFFMLHDISFPVWRRLYELAEKFREGAPWDWVGEGQLFGVENPEKEEIAYCVILGKDNPFPGLAMYKGERGLQSYLQARKAGNLPPLENCLLLSYEALNTFTSDEQELLEWLEISGEGSIPRFRDQMAGMAPWPLEEEDDARLLMFALEQSISMAIRQKENRDFRQIAGKVPSQILLRVPFRKGAMLLWKDEWQPLPSVDDPPAPAMANRLFLMSNCSKLPFKKEKKWWMEVYSSPELLRPPNQRPYYPVMLLVADAILEQPLGDFVFLPQELYSQLEIRFKDLLVFEGYRPQEIIVPNARSKAYLSEMAEILGIQISQTDQPIPLLEEMRKNLK